MPIGLGEDSTEVGDDLEVSQVGAVRATAQSSHKIQKIDSRIWDKNNHFTETVYSRVLCEMVYDAGLNPDLIVQGYPDLKDAERFQRLAHLEQTCALVLAACAV